MTVCIDEASIFSVKVRIAMVNKILVPVDGFEHAGKAVGFAMDIALEIC